MFHYTAIVALLLTACSDPDADCGIDETASETATLKVEGRQFAFKGWNSSPNNDCSTAGSPTSLTIDAVQTDADFHITFCIPRPEVIENKKVYDVGDDSDPTFQLININAKDIDCTYSLDFSDTASVAMTATFLSYCEEGLNTSGYMLSLAGTAPGIKNCGSADEPTLLTIDANRVAIEVP